MTAPRPTPARTRRQLLQDAGAAALAASLAPGALRGARLPGREERLRVGLVGCGGRGTGAAVNALRADPDVALVAMGDAFADRLDASLATLQAVEDVAARVQVDEEHRFVGFDAFREVIDACDVVLFATPPHFRPQHVEAAAAAGKHMFVEKPVATDVPGLRRVRAACEVARQKGVSLVAGLCYRYHNAKRETLQRVHDGAIGDVVAIQTTYDTGALWHAGRQPQWSDMEWQLRNWLYFTWLSGDHIVEQHIHSLDKVAWAMGDVYPARCKSSGGRIVRTDPIYGDVYDHFNTVYEWESGVKAFSSCRQQAGTTSDVSDHVLGTKGVAHLMTHRIEGEQRWRWRSEEPDDMYQNEHDALFRSIRAGAPIDDSGRMVNSTMMAIMARMSAYTGQALTWEQAWGSQLDLAPAAYAWGEAPPVAVARPGLTPFV